MRLAKAIAGFTLIEVMVTLVILMFGLLGLGGLIIKGHRAAYEAYQRHQALLLAADLAERFKANQAASPSAVIAPGTADNVAVANAFVALAPVAGSPLGDPARPLLWSGEAPVPNCAAVNCDRAQMVRYDLTLWEGQLLGINEQRGTSKIGGIVNARGCVEGPLPAPAPPLTYRISVSWQGDIATGIPNSSECGKNLYKDANNATSENYRRVVSVDVTVFVPI